MNQSYFRQIDSSAICTRALPRFLHQLFSLSLPASSLLPTVPVCLNLLHAGGRGVESTRTVFIGAWRDYYQNTLLCPGLWQ